MEKLIELLNEYDSGWDYDDYYGPYQYGQDRDAYIYGKYYLISKEYGFIRWLVENDKIDTEKKPTRSKYRLQQYKTELGGYGNIDKYSELLMLLSIQDKPIDFLISILK